MNSLGRERTEAHNPALTKGYRNSPEGVKRVLLLSALFPNRVQSLQGPFVAEPLRYLDQRYSVQVVAPSPWIPPLWMLPERWRRLRDVPSVEQWGSLTVYHPRFLAVPRKADYSLWGESYYRACRSLVKGMDFSLIHAHQIYPDGYAGLRLKEDTGKPLVVTLHGELEVLLHTYPHIIPKVRRVLEQADRVVTVAQYVAGMTAELGIQPDDRWSVIPNGYDPKLFYPRDRDHCRALLGLPSVKTAVYVGQFYAPKGLEHLMEAVAILRRQRQDFLVVLVGGGELEVALKEQARRLGIEPWVCFVGPKPREEVPLWMNAADVAVLPSVKEAFPTVLPEFMACGRPVVGSAVAGCSEIVSSERVGLLVPPADPEALAKGLAEGLAKEWDTEAIVEHARPYSFVSIARRLDALYDDVLSSDREGTASDGKGFAHSN